MGEYFKVKNSPDYWLTELSGLPFGINNQWYPVPGPEFIYREMVHGGTSCNTAAGARVRAFWRKWGIQDVVTKGYWDKKCPVRTGEKDVLASVFSKKDKALIVLASWAKEPKQIMLDIKWDELGMNPSEALLIAPEIELIQEYHVFDPQKPVPVATGEGWILSLEKN